MAPNQQLDQPVTSMVETAVAHRPAAVVVVDPVR